MLFNTKTYILLFLPFVLAGYFYLTRKTHSHKVNLFWLVLAGFVFYASWSVKFILLVLFSIAVNYSCGKWINAFKSRFFLTAGILFNICLLGYFKYTNFIIFNVNTVLSSPLNTVDIILPLGISFFTFTQIAYLVDMYKGKVENDDFLSYALFVNFFPHLLAGPIIHHKEMMSQFNDTWNRYVNWEHCYQGMFLFSIGLFKKVMIADFLAEEVNFLYKAETLDFWQSWAASLGYSMQLYFDFSGYSDMALGSALLFNIKLPINFNSPYKAVSIKDFWQRWHMTLSRFLRDYIYIPLGGNQRAAWRTHLNVFVTFLIGGFWHGAGWTFIIWGALHGVASVFHKSWQTLGLNVNRLLAIAMTFLFINITWVFFRVSSLDQAGMVLNSMFLPTGLTAQWEAIAYILLSLTLLFACLSLPNSNQLVNRYTQSKFSPYFISLAAVIALVRILTVPSSFFLYFQF